MANFTPESIIKGEDLMLFDNEGHSIAYATSHTLSISAETIDVNSKDHGIYGASEAGKITWEITSENLYTNGAFEDLFDKMVERKAVTVYFGSKEEIGQKAGSQTVPPEEWDPTKTVADGDYEYWTRTKKGNLFSGKVFITSLNTNANNGEKATFSVTLTGTGKITKVDGSTLA